MNYHPNNEAVALITLETMMLPAPLLRKIMYVALERLSYVIDQIAGQCKKVCS